ncbi:MAG: hypothetical protein MRZ98_08120 [Clostridiales bacterium]|nr:hypothetical protein [Clostridiales bacterium]
MLYALLLKPHANVRYRQSLQKLALLELECVLNAWGLDRAAPRLRLIAGEPFLVFEAGEMPEQVWRAVSGHSSICFAARLEGDALLPLERAAGSVMPDDLPHVLKYKGKTNADFTYLMLNCARAASAFAREAGPLCVLDPMCGKGTSLFCALCQGHNAVGIETDAKSLQEADQYFERSLKWHKVKHKRTVKSYTLPKGGAVRAVEYEAAPDARAMREGRRLGLKLLCGDAARAGEMARPGTAHLVVSDLPYGVQHAPREGGGMSSLRRLLERALPGCTEALKIGGAMALSFNENTLSRRDVMEAMEQAGLTVLRDPPYNDFAHWVEQAVERDMVVAVKNACKPTEKR